MHSINTEIRMRQTEVTLSVRPSVFMNVLTQQNIATDDALCSPSSGVSQNVYHFIRQTATYPSSVSLS